MIHLPEYLNYTVYSQGTVIDFVSDNLDTSAIIKLHSCKVNNDVIEILGDNPTFTIIGESHLLENHHISIQYIRDAIELLSGNAKGEPKPLPLALVTALARDYWSHESMLVTDGEKILKLTRNEALVTGDNISLRIFDHYPKINYRPDNDITEELNKLYWPVYRENYWNGTHSIKPLKKWGPVYSGDSYVNVMSPKFRLPDGWFVTFVIVAFICFMTILSL